LRGVGGLIQDASFPPQALDFSKLRGAILYGIALVLGSSCQAPGAPQGRLAYPAPLQGTQGTQGTMTTTPPELRAALVRAVQTEAAAPYQIAAGPSHLQAHSPAQGL